MKAGRPGWPGIPRPAADLPPGRAHPPGGVQVPAPRWRNRARDCSARMFSQNAARESSVLPGDRLLAPGCPWPRAGRRGPCVVNGMIAALHGGVGAPAAENPTSAARTRWEIRHDRGPPSAAPPVVRQRRRSTRVNRAPSCPTSKARAPSWPFLRSGMAQGALTLKHHDVQARPSFGGGVRGPTCRHGPAIVERHRPTGRPVTPCRPWAVHPPSPPGAPTSGTVGPGRARTADPPAAPPPSRASRLPRDWPRPDALVPPVNPGARPSLLSP